MEFYFRVAVALGSTAAAPGGPMYWLLPPPFALGGGTHMPQ